jgi:poly-gamma-glutamate synthesis protein (capsule biosynthesis protein)
MTKRYSLSSAIAWAGIAALVAALAAACAHAAPAAGNNDFRIVSLGDLLYTAPQAATDDPDLQKVLTLIKSANVAIANQEGEAFDLRTFTGQAYGAGQVYGQPTLAADYKAMGIGMVSMANNHSTDWGREGLRESATLLDAAGVVHAGSGATLADARRAGVLATANGRVALVAAASTFKANAAALDAFEREPARPGISTLRTRTVRLVTPEDLAKIRSLATDLASPLEPAPPADAPQLVFGERLYRVAAQRGLHYDMNLADHDGIVQAVRDARKAADFVVFGIHAHETPTGVDDDTPAPPDFLITLFHHVVDAGADVVMGGGPHALRGIEVYKGRVIFYGLGLFFFKPNVMGSQETVTDNYPPMPYPEAPDPRPTSPAAWYDSIMAVTTFRGGRLREVRLYPIDLRHEAAGHRGLPHLAEPEKARQILNGLVAESAQFGTAIRIQGSVGIIRP